MTEAEVKDDEVIDETGETEGTEPEVEVSEETKHWEERARRMGWRPRDEYGGNPDRWVDAKEFVERGETELPILRERFRKMDTRLAGTETKLVETQKRLEESTKVLVELRDMSRGAEERAYRRALSEIQAREREAVREASEEKFEAIQREKQALEQSRPKPVEDQPAHVETKPQPDQPPVGQINPIVEQWVADNPWFQSDRVLNTFAIEEDVAIKRDHPDWTVQEQLAEVRKRTMDKFPEKFGNKRRAAPPPVSVSTAAPLKPKGKTVKDLPPDAKAALERFKATIPGYKDEDYIKVYFAGEE